MAQVVAVCTSEQKGTKKDRAEQAFCIPDFGLDGDAHADSGSHRQVSLLAEESIAKMREMGFKVAPGDFAENITTRGMDLASLPIGTQLTLGEDTVLEITQIGKQCHSGCAIFRQVGKCIMPKEGVFARVLRGGLIRPGDTIIRANV